MNLIADAQAMDRALSSSIDPALKRLMRLRRDELLSGTGDGYDLGELAHFIVVEPNDALPDIEAALNYPILPDPPWEWVLDHKQLFEAPIIVSDDGFGIVLIVPDIDGVDATLLKLLRADAKIAT